MPVLVHNYLLVPDKELDFSDEWKADAKDSGLWASIDNVSEWLLVGKENVELSGFFCNKIGVSYNGFRNQGERCTTKIGE